MTITVITCTYNAAHELPRTLASDVWSAYAAVVHGNGLHDSSPNGLGEIGRAHV